MKHQNLRNVRVVSSVCAAMLALPAGSAQGQTPGQIAKFGPSSTVVDSVITEDLSGSIGIGTTAPVEFPGFSGDAAGAFCGPLRIARD